MSTSSNNKHPLPLIKLSKKEMSYVEDKWHHAILTYFSLHPTDDNRYNDMDLSSDEIEDIIYRYGIKPDANHWYWDCRA